MKIFSVNQMKNGQNNKRMRNDLLLVGGIILAAAIGGLCLLLFRGQGEAVEVTIDGKLYAEYSLSENRVEEIRSGEEQINRLIIRDGKAMIEYATCPDGICAAHRPIHREGESIVCLPHRVVIEVKAERAGDGPDAVV